MTFSKSFARTLSGTTYPVWEEVVLTTEEEKEVEEKCKQENFYLMDECLKEAKNLAIKNSVNDDRNLVSLAIALFEKRASHVIFWKESKAKEKFDNKK
ncbi:MAG: hypothetical protein WCV90_05650 [Candidatus Woesearchaeota archaeon]|jgi:hypothetical protein